MIREMQKSDWPRVSEIYTQAIDRGQSTFNTVCPPFEQWDKAHIPDCRYVYEQDGQVVAWVALSPTSPRPVFGGVVEVSIYVDEAYQGQGIGTELLNWECAESEKCGFWTLYVAIFTTNFRSIALHKKCGFREIGYREKIAKDKFGQWQNIIIMEKRSKVVE